MAYHMHMYDISCVARVIRFAIQAVANVKLVLDPSDGDCSSSTAQKKKKELEIHQFSLMDIHQ